MSVPLNIQFHFTVLSLNNPEAYSNNQYNFFLNCNQSIHHSTLLYSRQVDTASPKTITKAFVLLFDHKNEDALENVLLQEKK